MEQTSNQRLRVLTVLSLVMITVGSVDSIRNLPSTALFGSSLIFFFILAALFFLIPTALVAAELASTWSEEGGVYIWVREAFGKHVGFAAIWYQWIENVFWYPTILSFVAATFAYLFNPAIATNKYFLITVILITFYGASLVNLFGMKLSARFSTFCGFAGLIIPMAGIIALGTYWIYTGNLSQIQLHMHAILPNLHNQHGWVALTGIILSFCGMEIATVHGAEVQNPQRSYPRAMFLATGIILVTLMLGSLAIAIVLPGQDISLVAGIMQAFSAFLSVYHLQVLLPLMAILLIIGSLGAVSNWIIAPTKGLMVAARDGLLPTHLEKSNRFNAPKHLIIYQAIVVTILSSVFLFMPSVNGSYWLLTALAAQLYMMMYVIMFVAAIRLRYKFPHQHRPYRIPGGTLGIWVVAIMGLIGSITTFIIGFIPPDDINVGSHLRYDEMLLIGLISMSIPPLLSYRLHSRRALENQREP